MSPFRLNTLNIPRALRLKIGLQTSVHAFRLIPRQCLIEAIKEERETSVALSFTLDSCPHPSIDWPFGRC